VAEHRFGDFEVGNHTILHGPDGHDISRSASQHPLGFFTDGQDVGCSRLNGYNGRLPQYDSLIANIDQGICGAEVNSNVIGKQAFELRKHECGLTRHTLKGPLCQGQAGNGPNPDKHPTVNAQQRTPN
jgi:hypothetical protein